MRIVASYEAESFESDFRSLLHTATGAAANQNLRSILATGLRRIWLKAPAAARFVGVARAHHYELFAFHQPLRMHGRVPAADANRQQFRDLFRNGQQTWHRFKRPAAVVGVEPGHDHPFAEIRKLRADIHHFFAEELGFVDSDHFRPRLQFLEDFGGFTHVVRRNAQSGVRHDFVGREPGVDCRLENLHSLPGNLRPAQAADQLFALSRKHRADDNFDPAHVALHNIQDVVSSSSYFMAEPWGTRGDTWPPLFLLGSRCSLFL